MYGKGMPALDKASFVMSCGDVVLCCPLARPGDTPQRGPSWLPRCSESPACLQPPVPPSTTEALQFLMKRYSLGIEDRLGTPSAWNI